MMKIKTLAVLILVVFFLTYKEQVEVVDTERIFYETASLNNYLKNVSFEGVDFSYKREVTEYTFHVPFSKKTLGLTYEAENPKAIVDIIGDEELLMGNNSLAIIVRDENGNLREYDFTIIRESDSSNIENDEATIKSFLKKETEGNLVVNVNGNAIKLDEEAVKTLKDNKKTIIYEWKDKNGELAASLQINGDFIKNDNSISPNVNGYITTAKLVKFLNGVKYTGISTDKTNIPEGSTYKLKIDGEDSIYYLYYVENNSIQEKMLKKNDGIIQFGIKDGLDYAIVASNAAPSQKDISGFSWFWPSLFITVLFLLFIAGYKFIIMRMVRNSRNAYEKEKDELDEKMKLEEEQRKKKLQKRRKSSSANSKKKIAKK